MKNQNRVTDRLRTGSIVPAGSRFSAAGRDPSYRGGGGGSFSFDVPDHFSIDFSALANGALPGAFYSPTWAIVDGKAINTPKLSGTELLSNGNMETGNPPTGWAAGGAATLTGEADERTGGSGVQSLNIARGTSDTGASKSTSGGMVGWHKAAAWAKNIDANQVGLFLIGGVNTMSADDALTDWHTLVCSVLMTSAGGITARLRSLGATGTQVRYDDVSIQKLITADLFSTVDISISDVNLVAPKMSNIATGTQAGVVVALDSATTPANYVAVYYHNNLADGTTKIYVVQLVAGTYTTLSSTAVAYGSTKFISVKKSGDQLSVFYGTGEFSSQVGSAVTLNAALVSNTRHGIFSTDSSNTFSGAFKIGRYSP